jgi:hypothetical protein
MIYHERPHEIFQPASKLGDQELSCMHLRGWTLIEIRLLLGSCIYRINSFQAQQSVKRVESLLRQFFCGNL